MIKLQGQIVSALSITKYTLFLYTFNFVQKSFIFERKKEGKKDFVLLFNVIV